MLTVRDEHQLHRALELARGAVGLASPNPTVGCVLVAGGQVLGEGAHHFDQFDHAEIVALKAARAAGHDPRGATAYVTLEPCSHHGRTGPCADALIAAGIARCVVATQDPNPAVTGRGLARLRAAGVTVELAPLASPLSFTARRLNDSFAFAIQNGRPMLTLKAALSVDGRLAPPPASRNGAAPHWLTGPAARADVQELRHATDALLTGVGTVLADNPSLTDRTGLPRRRPLLRVVLDPRLRTPPDAAMLQNIAPESLLLIASLTASAEREETLRRAGAEVLRVASAPLAAEQPRRKPDEGSDAILLDLRAVLTALAERRVLGVLAEAGSTLNGSLLRWQLADKVVLYIAESELGAAGLPFAQTGPSPFALETQLSSRERTSFPHGLGHDIRLSGYLHDPWAGSVAG